MVEDLERKGKRMLTDTHNIPRLIHYCWFGRGEKPRKIEMCIKSWYKHLGDYQFMEWNEDNFDINSNLYVKQAYEAKKYTFVSNYVRLYALYYYGGIYLDTDVEVIKPLDRFLHHTAFSGFEDETYLQSGTMGAIQGHSWIKELLNHYDNRHFVLNDGTIDTTTNTAMMTNNGDKHGLQLNGHYQVLDNGVTFYPRTYFSPYDYINGANYLTAESYTIHHFAKSWLPAHVRIRGELKRLVGRYIGPRFVARMRTIFK